MRTTRGLILIAVVLTALVATGVALAKHVSRTAHVSLPGGGSVTASVGYTPKSYYDTQITLTVNRAGKKLLDAPVKSRACRNLCSVQGIKAVDLQAGSDPVVLLDLYTGGAHCCSVTDFYTYDATAHVYRQYEHEWGDPGYRLFTKGGQKFFETADDRFAYAFTDYAASGMPIQVLSYNGTRLVNVTTSFPDAIKVDAAGYLRAFTAQAKDKYVDTTGVIAAWAADEEELGNAKEVATFLTVQAANHHLNSGIPGEPQNAAYVTKLKAFLKKTGYVH